MTTTAAQPKKGDRVKPIGSYDIGTVKWVRADGMVVLVNWDDGKGCDHWGTSQLEVVA